MSRLQEYNPEFGVVFDEIDDAINAALGGTSGGGGAPPPKPAAPERSPPPAGTTPVPGNPNRAISSTVAYTYNAATGAWDPGLYPPSKDERTAVLGTGGGATTSSGTKTGGGTSYTPKAPAPPRDFAAENAANKQAQQDKAGAMASLPPRAVEYAPGRAYWHPQGMAAGSILTFNPETQRWVNNGYGPSAAERPAITQAIARAGSDWNAAPAPGATSPSTAATALTPPTAPPAAPRGNGMFPSAPDTQTLRLPGSVNNVAINNPNMGFSGFINKEPGTRAPASVGYGPAVSSNLHTFSQGARGFTDATNPIGPLSYTVPSSHNLETGFNNDIGAASPTPIGITTGAQPTSFDPFGSQNAGTVPLTMAGSNVNFSAPDKSWGTGFVLNAAPASNIALAQGRDFSGLHPAAQAAATYALLNEQMGGAMGDAYRQEEEDSYLGGGFMRAAVGGRYSYDPFVAMAGGGRAVVRPLAGAPGGPKELITNEPMVLVGTQSGRVRGLVGEDNADRDRRPDRELLRFSNNQMHVKPLDPPVRMAEGGIATAEEDDKETELGENLGVWAGYMTAETRDMTPEQREHYFWMQEQGLGNDNRDDLRNATLVPNYVPSPYGFADGKAPLPGYGLGELPSPYPSVPSIFIPQDFGETFGGSLPRGMQVFAEGGTVKTVQPYVDPGFTTGPVAPVQPAVRPVAPVTDPGFTTGPIDPMRQPTPDPGSTTGPVNPVFGKPGAVMPDPGMTTNPVIDPGGQVVPFDPFATTINAPWERAREIAARQDYLRRTVDDPRRAAGGLGRSTGVAVGLGQNATAVGPGMYNDFTGQINQVLGDIENAQQQARALGDLEDQSGNYARVGEIGENLSLFEKLRKMDLERAGLPPVIDTNPLYAREGEISTALELFDRMRNLDIQRVAALATDAAAKEGAKLERNAIAAQREAAANVFQQLQLLLANTAPNLGDGTQNPDYPKLYQAYLEANAKLVGIDTNLQQLDARIAAPSAEVVAIDTTLGDLAQKTAGLNEGTLQTERGVIRSALSQNQQRIERELELNNLINEAKTRTQGLNEADQRSQLALAQEAISKNEKRVDKRKEIQNLAKIGVPNITAPILPVDPFAPARAA